MIRNYIKIALRNLLKNKGYSFINIGGLAAGMAAAMLIGLWVWDELSFDRSLKNYDRLAAVWQMVDFGEGKIPYAVTPIPLSEELHKNYPEIKAVSLIGDLYSILSTGERKVYKNGIYAEPDFTSMMSLEMHTGTQQGLKALNSIMISRSLARDLFGDDDPMNKIVRVDNQLTVSVTGVYADFPENNQFKDLQFILPWDLAMTSNEFYKNSRYGWDNNSWNMYVQLGEGADFKTVSEKIRDIRMTKANPPGYKPQFFLHPLRDLHLYSEYTNGVQDGGRIRYVWLFATIGIFILLLACINFMNLSTARSEKRAKEVGIRTTVGSARRQLVAQFFSESLVVTAFAFAVALLVVSLALPFFNDLAGKRMAIPFSNPYLWLLGLGFSLVTGMVAGSYPAFYLSSFKPVNVLKGTLRQGRFSAIPRRVLVVLQFTVSVTLIIGTIVVFRQIDFAKSRPAGYTRGGLIEVKMNTPELYQHFDALRADVLATGAVVEFAESSGSITDQNGSSTDFAWEGKSPNTMPLFHGNAVTHEFGKAVGWEITAGRDFSRALASDTAAMILNEAAVKFIGFQKPINQRIRHSGREYIVIGVVKDILRESPFNPVKPGFFVIDYRSVDIIKIRLAPETGTREALVKVEEVFRKYNPSSPFDFTFVDQLYAQKFSDEERIGKLAGVFAGLAIFISSLGIFGLASFVAERRTKEIGIRKVLGASVATLWRLLSREFVILVLISLVLAMPAAYFGMLRWLEHYEYHTDLAWWIFVSAGTGALAITLLTVSYQSIRAAVANPVKSLRSE